MEPQRRHVSRGREVVFIWTLGGLLLLLVFKVDLPSRFGNSSTESSDGQDLIWDSSSLDRESQTWVHKSRVLASKVDFGATSASVGRAWRNFVRCSCRFGQLWHSFERVRGNRSQSGQASVELAPTSSAAIRHRAAAAHCDFDSSSIRRGANSTIGGKQNPAAVSNAPCRISGSS